MTWYRKRIAMDMETGNRHPVIDTLNDFECDLSPTIFFAYFANVPIQNVITECLDVLDITESLKDGLFQEEETQGEKIVSCLPMDARQEIGGIQCRTKRTQRNQREKKKI